LSRLDQVSKFDDAHSDTEGDSQHGDDDGCCLDVCLDINHLRITRKRNNSTLRLIFSPKRKPKQSLTLDNCVHISLRSSVRNVVLFKMWDTRWNGCVILPKLWSTCNSTIYTT